MSRWMRVGMTPYDELEDPSDPGGEALGEEETGEDPSQIQASQELAHG